MTAIRFCRFLLTILAVILFVGPVGAADRILSGGRLRLSHDGTGERENLSFRASGESFILPEAGVSDDRLAFTGRLEIITREGAQTTELWFGSVSAGQWRRNLWAGELLCPWRFRLLPLPTELLA